MAHPGGAEEVEVSPEILTTTPTTDSTAGNDIPPLRVLAFDTQSTCARLFSRSLSTYINLGRINHPYVIAATLGPDRIHAKGIGNEHTRSLWETRANAAPDKISGTTYEKATNQFLRDADKLEQKGKTLFVTEYAPFVIKHDIILSALQSTETIVLKSKNPSVISDELLEMFTPIIFIQHPAVVIPAWLRLAKSEYGSYTVDDDDFTIWTSLRWSRILFDYLRSNAHLKRRDSARVDSAHSTQSAKLEPGVVSTRPYVIDAADVANNTHATLAVVCRLLKIDLDTSSSWTQYFGRAAEALKKTIPNSLMKAFNSTVLSTADSSIDIDHEMMQWKAEFGDDVADLLRRKVEEDMVHYDYLTNFKLRIPPSRTMTAFMQNITGLPGRRQSAAPAPTEKAGVSPLRIIRSAIDGQGKRGSV